MQCEAEKWRVNLDWERADCICRGYESLPFQPSQPKLLRRSRLGSRLNDENIETSNTVSCFLSPVSLLLSSSPVRADLKHSRRRIALRRLHHQP